MAIQRGVSAQQSLPALAAVATSGEYGDLNGTPEKAHRVSPSGGSPDHLITSANAGTYFTGTENHSWAIAAGNAIRPEEGISVPTDGYVPISSVAGDFDWTVLAVIDTGSAASNRFYVQRVPGFANIQIEYSAYNSSAFYLGPGESIAWSSSWEDWSDEQLAIIAVSYDATAMTFSFCNNRMTYTSTAVPAAPPGLVVRDFHITGARILEISSWDHANSAANLALLVDRAYRAYSKADLETRLDALEARVSTLEAQ